jgi:hypothetical protein
MGPIFIHADPRIPKSEVDTAGERLLASGEVPFKKFFFEDPKTGWERVYAVKRIREGTYSMTFAIGSSRKEIPGEPGTPSEPSPVVSLARFRIQQVLGSRGRVLDPDVLPSYQFPWVACRLRSGAYRLVYVPGVSGSSEFRAQLQWLANRLPTQVCLAVDENHAFYFEPCGSPGDATAPPPRGGIWFTPARWTPSEC